MPWSGTLLRWYWNREEDFILIWNMEISITPTWHFHFVSDTLPSHFQIQPLGIRSLNHMQCWEAVRSYCINIQSDREFPFSKWSSLKLIIFIHWLMRIIIVQQTLFLLVQNFNKVMVVHTFFKACLFKICGNFWSKLWFAQISVEFHTKLRVKFVNTRIRANFEDNGPWNGLNCPLFQASIWQN